MSTCYLVQCYTVEQSIIAVFPRGAPHISLAATICPMNRYTNALGRFPLVVARNAPSSPNLIRYLDQAHQQKKLRRVYPLVTLHGIAFYL